MSKKGLGGKGLSFNKVVPKFLQNVKQTEVNINDKFQEYLDKTGDDEDEGQDQLEKDAIERAMKEERAQIQAEKDKEQELKELFEKEKEKRIQEDLEKEVEAQSLGVERKLEFKNPVNNVTTTSSVPTASINKKVSSKSLKQTTETIKKSFQQSPKEQQQLNKKKPTKTTTKTTKMLSFDVDEMNE